MSEFQSNEAYRELHADLLTRLKDDEDLRAVCQDLVRRFLSTKVGPRQGATATQEQVCMDYICAEAPLFLDTPAILGVPSSLNCYHQSLPSPKCSTPEDRDYGHRAIKATPLLPLMGAPPNDRDRSARGPVLCTWGSDS